MTEELSTFDKLVEELSRSERRELLRKIESTVSVSDEPLQHEVEKEPGADSEIAYQSLGFFSRILLFFKGLFTGKSPHEAFEDLLLTRLKKALHRECPTLLDFRRSVFLDQMKQELEALKESAIFFRSIITGPMEKDRPEFIAFLARCHCETLMKQLEDETEPRHIVGGAGIREEKDLKAEMENRFVDIIGQLDETDRKAIYLDYKSLDYLKTYSEVDFQAIIARFSQNNQPGGSTCSFADITKRLLHLAGILKSVQFPPSKIGLKALFLFAGRGRFAKTDELENFLRQEFMKAEEAITRIRTFNRNVPLARITKALTGDYNHIIEGLTGGEDWFVLFKKYWQTRLGDLYKKYIRDLRTNSVVEKSFAILGIRKFEEIKYYNPTAWDDKMAPAHWRSLSFTLAFFKNVFQSKFLKCLKILFINGEFYKSENRIEFTDAFNFLSTLNEKLLFFEKKLSPDGEIGKEIAQAKSEKATPDVMFKKLEPFLKQADGEALVIVERTIGALKTLNKILNGILYSDAGGKYDTLSNISYIGGKENQVLRKEWEKVISLSYELYQILYELRTAEAPK